MVQGVLSEFQILTLVRRASHLAMRVGLVKQCLMSRCQVLLICPLVAFAASSCIRVW